MIALDCTVCSGLPGLSEEGYTGQSGRYECRVGMNGEFDAKYALFSVPNAAHVCTFYLKAYQR